MSALSTTAAIAVTALVVGWVAYGMGQDAGLEAAPEIAAVEAERLRAEQAEVQAEAEERRARQEGEAGREVAFWDGFKDQVLERYAFEWCQNEGFIWPDDYEGPSDGPSAGDDYR